jgi:hypothetical protein
MDEFFGGGDFGGGGDFNIGGFFNAAGGAVRSLFDYSAARARAGGYQAAAGGYQAAAQYALQNVGYTITKTGIKLAQKEREIERVAGKGLAAIGHGGFVAGSGSAGDIFRNSLMEGGLSKSIIGIQGAIEVQAWRTQAASYTAMQQQAMASAAASKSSGFGSLLGAGLSLIGMLL